MATVEELEQTSSKPFIDIWQCTTAPLWQLVARNARIHQCSVSVIHFGGGWSNWTGFLIKLDYFGNVTLFQNKCIPLLFLWWCVWMRLMTEMIFLMCKWQKSMHLSFHFFTSQCTHPSGSCIVQIKKSQHACTDFYHLQYNKIISSHYLKESWTPRWQQIYRWEGKRQVLGPEGWQQ